MKIAIVEVAVVILRCPFCDVMLRQGDGNETWTREDFTGQWERMRCFACHEDIEIPKYAEVFPS